MISLSLHVNYEKKTATLLLHILCPFYSMYFPFCDPSVQLQMLDGYLLNIISLVNAIYSFMHLT